MARNMHSSSGNYHTSTEIKIMTEILAFARSHGFVAQLHKAAGVTSVAILVASYNRETSAGMVTIFKVRTMSEARKVIGY